MSTFATTLESRFSHLNARDGGIPLSIKLRSNHECFDCRGCNPALTAELDRLIVDGDRDGVRIERHETGPEWIIYATAATAGVLLVKSVVELVTAILKARSEGKTKGDKSRNEVDLIVRGLDGGGEVFEQRVLRIRTDDRVDKKVIERLLSEAVRDRLPSKDNGKNVSPAAKKEQSKTPVSRSKQKRK
jgi:hypothetical protein